MTTVITTNANGGAPLAARLFESKVVREAAAASSIDALIFLHKSIAKEQVYYANFPDVVQHLERTKLHVDARLAELEAEQKQKQSGAHSPSRKA